MDDGPIGQELIQIELGLKSWPNSNAKRHHFIPRFLLNRFADDDERLTQLDTSTGAPQQIGAKQAASRHHFYTFADEDGVKSAAVEGVFGMVESHAAPALLRLEQEGAVSDIDRGTISLFLAYLVARTPAAREEAERVSQEAFARMMAAHVADPMAFMELVQAQAEDDEEMRLTADAAEELRQSMLRMLKEGRLKITSPDGGAATNALIEAAYSRTILIYSATEWTLLRTDLSGFVTSDRGHASVDPTPQHPWMAEGIYSSPNAQTYFPISAESCLVISPGEPTLRVDHADEEQVMEANLRICGWADRYIYGSNQTVVAAVRRAQKKHPDLAAAPSPFRSVMLIPRDPDDDRIAQAHIARDWDPYLVCADENGNLQEMDYLVVGEDGDAVEIAIDGGELSRLRALKLSGFPPDADSGILGKPEIRVVDPTSIRPTMR